MSAGKHDYSLTKCRKWYRVEQLKVRDVTETTPIDSGEPFVFAHDPAMQLPEPEINPAAIALVARRELALQATGFISEVLEVDVTVPMLLTLATGAEEPSVHLAAVRALRCVESIAREDSAVVQAVGEQSLYHYVEGVIQYGAREDRYLQLMDELGLSAEGVTGLYALREAIAEETNGQKIGFPTLLHALKEAGISIEEAALDYEEALARLDEAGFIVGYAGSRIFDRPIFSVDIARSVGRLGVNKDTDFRSQLPEDISIDPTFPEERED